MVVKSLLRFTSPALRDYEVPCFEARGAAEGPTLTVIAGVHGCEYTSQLALRNFMRGLDDTVLRGRIRAVPTLNLASFYGRLPFVGPDGLNLNRSFPGNSEGSYSEALAHEVTARLITGSDYFIDLHAGDMVEDLTPFTLYEESAVMEKSRMLAETFGYPLCICQPSVGRTVTGSSTGVAADLGVPAIIAENGGRGLVEGGPVQGHINGLVRVVSALGMMPSLVDLEPLPVRHMSRFVWLRTSQNGWWWPQVRVGQDVREGDRLGEVLDLFGDVLEEVVSPEGGVPAFITSSPAVVPDGLLLGLAAGEEERRSR